MSSDSKTVRKKATNLLRSNVEGVWILAEYADGSTINIPIRANLAFRVERGNDLKLLYITNGIAKIPMMPGPLKCQHSNCCTSKCSGFVRGLTAPIIECVRNKK